MAARRISRDPGRPSCRSCFSRAVAQAHERTPHRGCRLSETKRHAKRLTPSMGDLEARAPSAELISVSCCSFEQPYNEQQNHRANNGQDESADEATGEMKAQ
jgi:hypothetical protein